MLSKSIGLARMAIQFGSVCKCNCFDWWWRSECHGLKKVGKTRSLARPITDNSKVRSRQHKDERSHPTLPARQKRSTSIKVLLHSSTNLLVLTLSSFEQTSISSDMVKPSTCCGKGDNCVCAQQATCSCGQQPAMNCICDKKVTENIVTGPRCSCR